ncbi:MAG: hypothetical protein FWD31_02455 [Planctomycetaceae bacterium]|nr:hypothetical protein [Planctomycetaceae bacterium]
MMIAQKKRRRNPKLRSPGHRGKSKIVSPRSLRHNFSWTLFGNVVLQLCLWGIISSYNKLGSSEAAGLYIAGLLIMQPLFHFTDFNLRQIFVTDVANRWEFRDYLAHRLIWSFFAVMFGTLIALFVFPGQWLVVAVNFVMGLAIAGQSLSELFHALFQKHERFDTMARSLILRGLLCLVGVCAVFYVTQSVLLSLVAMTILRFLTVLVYDFPAACLLFGNRNGDRLLNYLLPRFSPATLTAITWLGLPLAVNMGVLSLTPQIPRFWLEKQEGLAALGQYGSIAMLMSVGLMTLNSLGVTMSQRFAKSYAAGDRREFFRLTAILVGTAFGMGCIGLLVIPICGGLILTVAYTSEYASLTKLFWLITFGATFGFVGNALGYPVTAARRFGIQPVICLVQATITMIGCALLVPRYDMSGAAWAVAAANIVHAGLFAWVWCMAYKKMANNNFHHTVSEQQFIEQ